MSEKERQKKDGRRKDKDHQAMREHGSPRNEQASVRYGEQERVENIPSGVAAIDSIT